MCTITIRSSLLLLLVSVSSLLSGVENLFTGTTDTSWTTPGNWSLGHIPNSDEDVRIPAPLTAVIANNAGDTAKAKNITISSNGTLSLNDLGSLEMFEGGLISIQGTFNVGTGTTTLNQTKTADPTAASPISGTTIMVASGGTLAVGTNAQLTLSNGIAITNAGTITLGARGFLRSDANVTSDITDMGSATLTWTYDANGSSLAPLQDFHSIVLTKTLQITKGTGVAALEDDRFNFIQGTTSPTLPTWTALDPGYDFSSDAADAAAVICRTSPATSSTVSIASPSTSTIYGTTLTLSATASNGGAITWTSDQPSIIDPSTGVCLSTGTATLTATAARTATTAGSSASTTITVAKRPVTITIPTKTITAGTTPTFSSLDYSISNLMPGDNLGISLTTSVTSTSAPDTYPGAITIDTSGLNSLYTISGTPTGTIIVQGVPPSGTVTSGGGGGGGCGLGSGLGLVLGSLAVVGWRRRR